MQVKTKVEVIPHHHPPPPLGQIQLQSAVYEQDQELTLSEEDIALLDELERQALNGSMPSSTPTSHHHNHVIQPTPSMQLNHPPPSLPVDPAHAYCMRLLVVSVEQHQQQQQHSVLVKAKTLSAVSQDVIVELYGDWIHCEVKSNDTIHVVFINEGFQCSFTAILTTTPVLHVHITNQHGLLVINPDTMLSPTKIADACQCMRKSVLSDRLQSFGNVSAAAVMGNLRHSFIEVGRGVESDHVQYSLVFAM